jgi:hypothetical protein
MRGKIERHPESTDAFQSAPAQPAGGQLAWKIHEELAGADQAVEIV